MIVGDDINQGGEVLEYARSQLIADEQRARVRLKRFMKTDSAEDAMMEIAAIARIAAERDVVEALAADMGIEFGTGEK